MHCLQVKAWLALRTPAFAHPERLSAYALARDSWLSGLEDACSVISSTVALRGFEFADPPADVRQWCKERSFMANTRFCEYVRLDADVSVDTMALAKINSMKVSDLEPEFVAACAASDLSGVVENLQLLSELADPGCIDSLTGLASVDGLASYPIHSKGTYSVLKFPEADDPSWPPLQQIAIQDVAEWAKSAGMFECGLATSRVQRALAAFSHVVGLTWQRHGDVLFRAMQGLEAFYCDGVGDLRRQLSEKSKIWLGSWEDRRNVVGALYDLRSKFVHGSAKLEFWNHHHDAWSEDEKAMKEFAYGQSFAVRLLVATLQKSCVSKGKDITWSFSVAVKSDA